MPAAARTYVAFTNLSQVGEAGFEVAAGLHAAQVPVVPVRTDDVLALAQCLVRDHLDSRPDRPDGPALGAEGLADLDLFRRPEVLPEGRHELHLVEAVV